MAWKVKGKIGFTQGNNAFDTYHLMFSKDGVQGNLVEIGKVKFLTPADATRLLNMSQSDAIAEIASGKYDVWERYWEEPPSQKKLVAGDAAIAIQFKPNIEDISVTDIGIFTAEMVSDRTAKIKIFHESGLCVAAVNGDAKTSGETLYDLHGDKRDTVINSTTLYTGQTYYIVYYGGQYNWEEHVFYPAYFQNSTGTGVYKEYTNNLDANQITITEVSENSQNFKPSKFAGVLNSTSEIFGLSENSWFSWHSNPAQTGMTNGDIYKRNNTGSSYTFKGIVGDPTDQNHQLSEDDITTMIGLPNNSMFVLCVSNFQGITWNNVYAKVAGTWNAPTTTYEGPTNSQSNLAVLPGLVALYNANNGPTGNAKALCISGYSREGNGPGYSIKMASGNQNYVSSTTPETTLPTNPQEGDIHYFAEGVLGDGEGIYKRFSNYWGKINMYYQTPFDLDENISDWLTLVGSPQDFMTRVGSVPDDAFLAATENTTRKYYLKINGNEV